MKYSVLAPAMLATLAAVPAAAQVTLDNKVLREEVKTAPNGARTTTLVPTRNIAPGATAVYVMTYKNGSAKPVSDLVISNPVPRDVVYIGAGANSPAPSVSVDGGRTFGPIERATVRSGASVRPAQFSDVTNVRWVVTGPVAPGASGSVSYRARIR